MSLDEPNDPEMLALTPVSSPSVWPIEFNEAMGMELDPIDELLFYEFTLDTDYIDNQAVVATSVPNESKQEMTQAPVMGLCGCLLVDWKLEKCVLDL